MKGDFSRAARAQPGLARVLMQQGRVQLDADWNLAADVAARRAQLALADLLGRADPLGVAAVPRDAAGFGIAVRGGYRFDGRSSHLHVAGVPSLGGDAPFAIETTVARRAHGRGGTIVGRFQHDHRRRPHGEFALRIDAHGRPSFLRVESGGVRALTARFSIPPDAHTEIAVLYDGEAVTMFVNGRFAARRGAGRGRMDGDVRFLVGAHAAREGVADVFDGTIDTLEIAACTHRHRHHRHREHERCAPAIYTLGDAHPHGGEHPPERLPQRIVAGAGRAYVGGMLCENAAEIALDLPAGSATGTHLAYLEVWERLVTAAEDPALADPALGGVDTSAAVRTEARVRIAPFESAVGRLHAAGARGSLAFEWTPGATPLGNQLVRVEVHRSGLAAMEFEFDDAGLREPARVDTNTLAFDEDPGWTAGQPLQLVTEHGPNLSATVASVSGDGYTLAAPPPPMPFRVAALATVKWSLDNGAIAFALPSRTTEAADRYAFPDPTGRIAELASGDVVEILDRDDVREDRAGTLAGVKTVLAEPGTTTIELTGAPPAVRFGGGLMRLWTPFGGARAKAGQGAREATVSCTAPLELAPGFTASFTPGTFRAGDYWSTPLRVDVDGLWSWPVASGGEPLALPPFGVERRFAPLALLEPGDGDLPEVEDLRRVVEPLADDGGDLFAPRAVPLPPEPPQHDAYRAAPAVIIRERDEAGTLDVRIREDGPDGGEEIDVEVRTEPHRHEHDAIVLSPDSRPPHGYRFAGMTVAERPLSTAWEALGEAPRTGPALSAVLHERLYAFYETTGELWVRDPGFAGDEIRHWQRCSERGVARDGGALVALDGHLYAVGGEDDRGRPSGRCDAYDPGRDAWDAIPPLRTARASFGAAAVDGRLVVLGGVRRLPLLGRSFASERVESWRPDEPRWRREPALSLRRAGCGAAGRGRRVYLAGGSTGRFWGAAQGDGAAVDVVAPFEGTSWARGSLAVAQREPRVVLVGDDLIVAGGLPRGGGFTAPERFRLTGDGGEPLGTLDRLAPGLAAVEGTVYAIAGESPFRATNLIERCTVASALYVHRRERERE